MDTNNFISITSGFIIPRNEYYNPVQATNTTLSDILSHSQINHKERMIDFFTQNNIYSSDIINNLLNEYQTKKKAEDFYNMIEVVYNILSKVDLKTFFSMQATNPYLSNTCFDFCLNLIMADSNKSPTERSREMLKYSYIPFNIRFNFDVKLNKTIYNERQRLLDEKFNNRTVYDMKEFLANLVQEPSLFLTFYKFMLADVY